VHRGGLQSRLRLLENYIRQLIEAHQTPAVILAWQGGVPTRAARRSSTVERLHENGVPLGPAVADRSVTTHQYGQFLDHEYTFEQGGRKIAETSKKWFRLRD